MDGEPDRLCLRMGPGNTVFFTGCDGEVVARKQGDWLGSGLKLQSCLARQEYNKFCRVLIEPESRFTRLAPGHDAFDADAVRTGDDLDEFFGKLCWDVLKEVVHDIKDYGGRLKVRQTLLPRRRLFKEEHDGSTGQRLLPGTLDRMIPKVLSFRGASHGDEVARQTLQAAQRFLGTKRTHSTTSLCLGG